MYTFIIKENGPDINVAVTRSLLALAGIASLVYRSNQYYFINLIAALALLCAAVFVKSLLLKLKDKAILLMLIAAMVVLIATRSVIFSLVLLICGVVVKFFNVVPTVSVNTKGINIRKMLNNPEYEWIEFNNIILKDNLLTLDFKNNKLLQLTINENENTVDEYSFNTFCSGFIGI